MATQLWAIGLVLLGTFLGSPGPIFLKKASAKINFKSIKNFFNLDLIIGCSLYGLGTILFIPALRGGELSVLYPFVALSYVWVSLLSIKFLKEKMNNSKWSGIALIILGIILIGIGG